MMSRFLFITLYILQNIFYTHGQYVQTKTPEHACVSSTLTLRCPNNYVVVVRDAAYGVAQVTGACTYSTGDCIADAMNIITCTTDSVICSIYATRKKLPQCNDQYSSYIRVEYDCVPMSMEDSTKDYNVCQNGTEITTDHGILRSPGYPTQFQTTSVECFRAIRVPNDKTIRLWLSDMYIGSTSTNCANDHVYVVDSIQTYRHCGLKRVAYPYLCSSTILIQYLVKTQGSTLTRYRGMRMYFEITDRPANDNCPNPDGTVTPIPTTPTGITTTVDPGISTTAPVYVTLGIASPRRSFQLCKGESHLIECPNNYAVAVTTNIFGVTPSDQCEPHDADKHCVVTTDPVFACRQRCTYLYSGNRVIPSCNNKVAAYQYVEYQCIPTNSALVSPNTACPADGSKIPVQIDRKGRFQNYNYPNLQKMNCTYRLKTKPGDILNIYSLDISLNDYQPECQSNKVTLIEDGEDEGSDFCEQRSYGLIYSSCSNELDLRYIVNDVSPFFSSGAQLYIESQARPLDWSCGAPLTTPSSPATSRTTPFTTPTAKPLTNETNMFARDELEHDICISTSFTYTCPTGYTFMIIGAFYGVKKQASNKCAFTQGDCAQEALSTITACRNDVPNCYLAYSSKRRLAHCSDNYADYLHITSQCVPSKVASGATLDIFNICETNDPIRDINGVVTSPRFPNFVQTSGECRRTIQGVQERALKIWINEMAVASGGQRSLNDDSDEPDLVIYKTHATDNLDNLEEMYPSFRDTCISDYLIIDAPHVAYVYCGTRKLAVPPICAGSVIIQYRATSPPSIFYKGFKLYFEWVEKPAEIVCPGDPQPFENTTIPITPILPSWAQNLELSPILSTHICLGTATTIRCPRGGDYVLSIIESNYGVTGTGLCEIPSTSHCHQEASLGLTCTQSCYIEYILPKPLSLCGQQNANYINIDYECIPTRLPNNENPIDICASTSTSTIALNKGMMVSPQYPTLGPARTCSKKIETVPGKLWMVFLVDVFLEGNDDIGTCNAASLTINDGNDKIVLCGLHQPELVLISCSNIVDFNFVSTHQALGYRGFKVFFQTIDEPDGWGCSTTTSTTRLTTRTTPTSTLLPPSFQVAAFGGTTNGTRQYCKFPFTYQGKQESTCVRSDPPSTTQGNQGPWCSLTSNFDNDRQWGFCDLGITDTTMYDICRSQSQLLRCPAGYVIDILTADYAAKPDGNTGAGSCIYDKNDCFQSDASTIQNVCAGKPSCTAFHITRTLVACQNRPSAYLHIDYHCIPNEIPDIMTINMCDSAVTIPKDTRRGFIISPNFPNTPNNIDCTFKLETPYLQQDIHLYILDVDLSNPTILGQTCTKDRLIVTADNNIMEMCGRVATNFLVNTCHKSVLFQLIRPADGKGRGVKFYFEFRDRPLTQPCPIIPPLITTPAPATTTTGPPPTYFPDPSPREIKTLCYPDLSSLFGAKNFKCPQNYMIVILRAFYGKGSRCDYTSGDCTTEADIVYRTCSGKQECSLPFINIVTLPECNNAVANYLLVEFQCLPTPTIVPSSGELCTTSIDQFGGVSGVLRSPSYPIYTQTQCANTTLSSFDGSNLVIYMYLLDLDIGSTNPSTGECANDYLLLSYQCNNQLYTERLCGTRTTELLFSTCTPTDKIFASYNLLSQSSQNQRGFALLYHLLPKIEPPITTTTERITTAPQTTTGPAGPGPVSTSIGLQTTCVQQSITIRCNTPGYVLVIHRVQLAVSADNTCNFSPTDCFHDRTDLYNTCGGKTSCYIFPPLMDLPSCNKAKSKYLYVEYQCLPTRPKVNLDICSSTNTMERVEGGAIVSSLNYKTESRECKVQLQSNKLLGSPVHKAFKIYVLSLNLPMRSTVREQGVQCSSNNPMIEIDDSESGVTRLCGDSHTRYLLETCSPTIDIRFKNVNLGPNTSRYKGFELYFESVQNDKCRPTVSPPIPTLPFGIKREVACALSSGRERVDFSCIDDYGLVILQSYHFVTKQPGQCDVTQNTCHYPIEQPKAQCSGQQACSYTHVVPVPPQINPCMNGRADSTEFYYQCLPMKPLPSFTKSVLCHDTQTADVKGFIETQGFPNTYQYGMQQCSLRILKPNNNDGKKYSIYLYIIDLSMRDTSAINPSAQIECIDSIKYTDGDTTYPLCGKTGQPVLQYSTDAPELNITINISQIVPQNELNVWHGARLFYIIDDQQIPNPPSITTIMPSTATATVTTQPRTTGPEIGNTTSKPDHTGAIAASIIIVFLVLGGLIGFVFYRRRVVLRASRGPTIRYDADMGTLDGATTNGTLEKRSSIPTASLKGPASSTFISPFYTKPQTTEKQEVENQSDA